MRERRATLTIAEPSRCAPRRLDAKDRMNVALRRGILEV
jgi:hypothetical protein